jgi:hypothetical protein
MEKRMTPGRIAVILGCAEDQDSLAIKKSFCETAQRLLAEELERLAAELQDECRPLFVEAGLEVPSE